MKYIKTFEKINNLLSEGSEVILLYAKEECEEKYLNGIFLILEVDEKDTDYPYKIYLTDDDDWFLGWVSYDQIQLATIEEIEEYELRKNANKYNL